MSILDAVRIEEVVSDFVSLKRRGANLLGVCPFHKEKTPSFIVSPAKGIFKCFGCGKAGDSVRFIMEHEHYSYPEALRYLANKYGIIIEEKELSPEELMAQNEREKMFNINTFAQQYFSNTMKNDEEGQAVGMSYFRERGFRDAIVDKFQLGYCLNQRDAFIQYALKNGYSKELLLSIGLASGNGTYTQGDTVTGYGYAYDVYVTVTDSNGTSHTSNTITVSNKTSGGNYYNTETKTFTFGGVYVAAGATVTFRFHFTRKSSPTIVVIRNRGDSSTYGGTVINGGGLVRINIDGTASGWKSAIPYINVDGTASGWKVAIPYINKDGSASGWTICT